MHRAMLALKMRLLPLTRFDGSVDAPCRHALDPAGGSNAWQR